MSHASALQALERGDASPYQQNLAIKWIVNNLCRTYDLPYFPDSTRDTDLALGKQVVGKQLVKLLKIDLSLINKEHDDAGPEHPR